MPRRNPTTPVPASIPLTEPALMTREEFLDFRNPDGKSHSSEAYETSLATLNRGRAHHVGTASERRGRIAVYGDGQVDDDNLIFRDPESDRVIGVLADGVLYRDRFRTPPEWYQKSWTHEVVNLRPREVREVKYPEQYAKLVDDVVALNRKRLPVLLQRVMIDGEKFEVRAEREPRANRRDTIAFVNADGLVVASGADEWGASLLAVAEEYRGRGLGRAIAALWYEINPESKSGGFTPSGRANAIATWEERVREFLARGWYSQLVRDGVIFKDRVKKILAGLGKRRATSRLPEIAPEVAPDLRVFVDPGVSFILYDARFLEEPDEKYIYGYGFLRESDRHGTYFFRIEYEPEYATLATAIGLQLARDAGDAIYVAQTPGDIVEWELVPGAVLDDGYVRLTRDVLPLKELAAAERRLRRKVDQYDEICHRLVELADSRDWDVTPLAPPSRTRAPTRS